jgi:hypothetical protein
LFEEFAVCGYVGHSSACGIGSMQEILILSNVTLLHIFFKTTFKEDFVLISA